jgi:hypothetical protein
MPSDDQCGRSPTPYTGPLELAEQNPMRHVPKRCTPDSPVASDSIWAKSQRID